MYDLSPELEVLFFRMQAVIGAKSAVRWQTNLAADKPFLSVFVINFIDGVRHRVFIVPRLSIPDLRGILLGADAISVDLAKVEMQCKKHLDIDPPIESSDDLPISNRMFFITDELQASRAPRLHGAFTPSAWLTSHRLAGDNQLDRFEIGDGYGRKSRRVGTGNKRAEIAGMIARAQQQLGQFRADLVHLDATIRLFAPAMEPHYVAFDGPKPGSWPRRSAIARWAGCTAAQPAECAIRRHYVKAAEEFGKSSASRRGRLARGGRFDCGRCQSRRAARHQAIVGITHRARNDTAAVPRRHNLGALARQRPPAPTSTIRRTGPAADALDASEQICLPSPLIPFPRRASVSVWVTDEGVGVERFDRPNVYPLFSTNMGGRR